MGVSKPGNHHSIQNYEYLVIYSVFADWCHYSLSFFSGCSPHTHIRPKGVIWRPLVAGSGTNSVSCLVLNGFSKFQLQPDVWTNVNLCPYRNGMWRHLVAALGTNGVFCLILNRFLKFQLQPDVWTNVNPFPYRNCMWRHLVAGFGTNGVSCLVLNGFSKFQLQPDVWLNVNPFP